MPSGSRVRANNVYGTVTDNPLLIGAVSFTSLGLSLLPAISGEHAVIVLDPKRVFGEPEIVVVTAHLAMGTTATITRGQYGTVARQHPQGTAWAHVPVGPDDYTAIVTSGTRPVNPYKGQEIFETDTDVTSWWSGSTWEQGLQIGAWKTYVPTLTQGATVAKTVQSARYVKVGRTVIGYASLLITGSGTATNVILVGLPVAAEATAVSSLVFLGASEVFDSPGTLYRALTQLTSSTTVRMAPTNLQSGGGLGQVDFTAALVAGDVVNISFHYESAS